MHDAKLNKVTKIVPIDRHILSFIRAQALALTPPPSAKYRGSGVERSRLDKRSYTVVYALVFGYSLAFKTYFETVRKIQYCNNRKCWVWYVGSQQLSSKSSLHFQISRLHILNLQDFKLGIVSNAFLGHNPINLIIPLIPFELWRI